MPNARELLNNPGFQAVLIQNAERWFNLEQLIKEPTVVFDRGDEFWTTIMNSPKCKTVLEKISSGKIIPINADSLGDIAQVHSAFHTYLAESDRGIPTIPTIVNITGESASVGNYQLPKEIPGIFVKKTSYEDRKMTSHRGEGVSIIRLSPDNLSDNLPRNRWEFLQPFIVPPDEFVRDIRVYVVGGRPVAGLIRRARKPLLPENLMGEVIPNQEQYPSAQFPGPNEHLAERLKDKVFGLVTQIAEILDKKVRSRTRPFSPYISFGFGSIDFLLDANGTPLPVDFDINPSVSNFEDIHQVVATSLGSLLYELSSVDGLERKILLIGFPNEEFLKLVLINLRNKLPTRRVIFQETIFTRALREKPDLPMPKKSTKIGRNEPCPCGSGKKYKKCHG